MTADTPRVVKLPVGDDPPMAELHYGCDSREVLGRMPSNHVHCVVTSPPYWGLRQYGADPLVWGGRMGCDHRWGDPIEESRGAKGHPGDKSTLSGTQTANLSKVAAEHGAFCEECGAWCGDLGLEPTPDLYVEHMVEVFREVRRVLRDDGTLWLNLGDTFNAGRSGGHPGGKAQWDPSQQKYPGRSGVNAPGLKPKDLVGVPWRVALALQEDGWWLRNAIIWHKANHLPHPVRDRMVCAYEFIFLLSKSKRYFFDLDAIRVPHTYGEYEDDGTFTPAQQWLSEDPSRTDRKLDRTRGELGTFAGPPRRLGRGLYNPRGKNPGDVWMFPTCPFPGAHFAVFPPVLPERCILAGTSAKGCCPTCGAPWRRVRGEVLEWEPTCECGHEEVVRPRVIDPFSGSGTTGMVALETGRDYIGIDPQGDYLDMAAARVVGDGPPEDSPEVEEGSVLDLFGECP